nr:putative mitochondrial protein [Tanacetum cinerariifolium]
MASGDSDPDAEYALSKLLQMGTVAEYQNDFEMLIKRVTIPESLLKSFYISGLKLDLQCLLLRSNPKTLDEAFSLAHFFKARITEARFKIIAREEKEHIVEKKIDVILPLQGEFASPNAEGSLNADEYTGVEEVVDGGEALGIGEDNDLGDAATNEGDDVVESGDISILNSHIGHRSSRSLQL